jgi:hypothetical protein
VCNNGCCKGGSYYSQSPVFTSTSTENGGVLNGVIGYGAKNGIDTILMAYEKANINVSDEYVSLPYKSSWDEKKAIQDILYYKVNEATHRNELASYEEDGWVYVETALVDDEYFQEIVDKGGRVERGTRVYNFAVDVEGDKDIMVYTYMKYAVDYSYSYDLIGGDPEGGGQSNSHFLERVLGVINISHPDLPPGYRREFIINDSLISPKWQNYNAGQEGSVGIKSSSR